MQKTIMKDPLFLSQKSTAADPKIDAKWSATCKIRFVRTESAV